MAKPYAQTGHGSSSGTTDESSLPHGEASRRAADDNADASKADWGLSDAKDESKLSRILGLVLVLVLAGVFSFIAYRKYNEARLHPAPDTAANGPISGQQPAGIETQASTNGEAQNQAAAAANNPSPDAVGGAAIATNSAAPNQSQSAFQLDDSASANAPFHPKGSGAATDGSAEKRTGEPARKAQTAANENDVNPFGDTVNNATPPNANAEKANQPESNRPSRPDSRPVATGEQAEPLFDNTDPQPGAATSRRNGQIAADAASMPQQESGKVSAQFQQPVQTAHSEPAASIQVGAAANPPAQSEPGTNDLLRDSPKPAAIAKEDRQSMPAGGGPNGQKAPATGLLDQEEPVPTTTKRDPSPVGAGAPTSLDAGASGRASDNTTAHVGVVPSPPSETTRGSDNEDLFAAKTADTSAAPQTKRSISPSSPVGPGADSALNEPGDYYVVKPQDSFWTISRQKYGTARYFRALAELNKAHVPDPARMRPGVKVSTPPAEILETRFAQFLPKGTAVEVASGERPAGKSGSAGFFTSADGKPMYRTGESDTLSNIAARHLGRASRWIQIYEMNRDRLATPNQLKIGTELALPADSSNVAVTNDGAERR
jgi:LysM repeat protein